MIAEALREFDLLVDMRIAAVVVVVVVGGGERGHGREVV